MANEPIEPQAFLGGVTVVDIGDARVARGMTRRPHVSCRHNSLVYDNRERRVWCSDCERDVDPFDAFEILVKYHDDAVGRIKRREKAVAEAEAFSIISIAAKTIDKAWRSKNMVPACPSCGNGLFPDDFKKRPTMIGKDFAAARRGKKP
jgi:ribosomal protein S27E